MIFIQETLKQVLIWLAPTLGNLFLDLVAALVAWLILRHKKRKKQEEFDIMKLELEMKKLEVQQMIVDNSYIVCPECDNKIKIKDAKIITNKEVTNEKIQDIKG